MQVGVPHRPLAPAGRVSDGTTGAAAPAGPSAAFPGLSKMPQKVLVTGASGLIGGLIVTKLEDKYEFSALNRSPLADWK